MGKAVASAILLVMQPDRYGPWNNPSESALRSLGLWPAFSSGESLGSQYAKVNEVLCQLSQELGTDLWTLDALFYGL